MKLPPGFVEGNGHVRQHYSGYGKRLMQKMGWSDGKGLGKNEDGMTEHIRVKKKEDNLGIGGATGYRWDSKWWEGAFNSIAAKISAVHNREDGGDSSSSDSDESSAPSAGAARHRDGTLAASASREELRILNELGQEKWGRWGGREGKMARIREQEEQMAREARAKLGLSPVEADGAGQGAASGETSKSKKEKKAKKKERSKESKSRAVDEGPKGRPGREEGGAEDGAGDSRKDRKSKKRSKKAKDAAADEVDADAAPAPAEDGGTGGAHSHWGRFAGIVGAFTGRTEGGDGGEAAGGGGGRQRVTVTVKRVAYEGTLPPTTPEADPQWWGRKVFVSVGFVGSARDEILESKKGFTEDDQERVFMFAHNHARGKKEGKMGLGASHAERPTTLGKDFAGSKRTFGDEDGAEGEAGEAPSGSQDSLAAVVVEKDGRGAGKGSGGRKREGVEGERAVGGDESSPKRKDKKEKKEKRAKGGKRERGKEAKAEEGSGGAGDGEGRKKNKKRREK